MITASISNVPDPAAPPVPAELDREQFSQVVRVPALRAPATKCQSLVKSLRGYTLNIPKVRSIVLDGANTDTRLLLLQQDYLQDMPVRVQEIVSQESLEITEFQLALNYSNFSTDQVIKKLVPAGVEVQTAFETVGHIAHLNLREECLPYKHLIGQAVIDKNPHLRTVVNKVGQIENEFRVFPMEVIAGEASFETELVQCGVKFKLDFSKVYWNSRLETEHKRLVALFKPDDVILDVMAGIGPFAVPAGKRGCTVLANDLNPESHRYLVENIKLNKVGKRVRAFCMDGREFIRQMLDPATSTAHRPDESRPPTQSKDGPVDSSTNGGPAAGPSHTGVHDAASYAWPTHAIMNLPASAVEFLDAFRGAFPVEHWKDRTLPTVHCYTFKKGVETEEDVVKKVEHYLGGRLDKPADIHVVRTVAPGKLMLCVSFTVPAAVAFMEQGLAPDDRDLQKEEVVPSTDGSDCHVPQTSAAAGIICAKRQKLDKDAEES